jgi:hypothetical protein
MKKKRAIFTIAATSLLLSALPLFGAEWCPISFTEYGELIRSNMKDQCLIVEKKCDLRTDMVQQRVNELRLEIAKGRNVYNAREMKLLKEQLQWIEADSGNRFI